VAEKTGQSLSLRATIWPRGQAADPGVVEVKDASAKAPPVISMLIESKVRDGGGFKALVHGYGCSVGEEVELWEKHGLIVVGLGSCVVILDAHSGAVRQRIPTGGYFNSLCVPDDGRDVFVCGDEHVIRVVPPGAVGWQKQLGVDGVVVHRAVGPTVFVSAQRRVGGPWVDFLLDRTTGAVVEAPEGDDDQDAPPPKTAVKAQGAQQNVKSDKTKNVQRDTDAPDDDDDDAAVRMVRDDETDPDDE